MVDAILIVLMLLGITTIFISMKMSKSGGDFKPPNYLEIENTIRAIDTSINEADQAIENLNKLSQNVFDEFEQKYQEILFLYSLIDEKKKDIAEIYNKPIATPVVTPVETPVETPVKPDPQEISVEETPEKQPSAPQITVLQGSAPQKPAPQKPSSLPLSAMKNSNLQQILKLQDDGMDVAEIAKTLDIGQGEVQLILGLGKR